MRRRTETIADLATYGREFVRVRPLARYLEVDERTIRRMILEGSLAAVRVGRQWRIPIDAARATFHEKRHSAALSSI